MAVSADGGLAAWGLLIIDSDQCLGHSDGTVVKADKSHFTLLINLLLLKRTRFPVIFTLSARWRQTVVFTVVRGAPARIRSNIYVS